MICDPFFPFKCTIIDLYFSSLCGVLRLYYFSSFQNGKYVFGHIEIYIDGLGESFVLATVCIHFKVSTALAFTHYMCVCMCVWGSVCMSVWQLICGPAVLLLHINNDFFAISTSASVYLSIRLSICLSLHQFIRLPNAIPSTVWHMRVFPQIYM